MAAPARHVATIVGLLCLLPELTTCQGGFSESKYGNNVLIEGQENDRRVFAPLQSRDFGNVIVDEERNRVYVGAVNFLYSLDADDVTVIRGEIRWAPERFQLQTCINFKGDSLRCQNTIRVLHSFNDTHIFACGTMAFSPACIYVNKKDFTKPAGRSERGKWRSPEDPLSSAISTMSGSCLFTATTPSSPNKNGVICKTVGEGSTPVKTNENDDFWLSDPHFVSIFTVPEEGNQEKAIVLLKENAKEVPLEILTQNNDDSLSVVYSRLVSVCANDLGGNPWILKDKFATFVKMRIACPVQITREKSRSIPFFYDEIQSSFLLPNSKDPSNPTIYAIFTTPRGAFEATATCVFEMNDVRKYLATTKHWNRPGKRDLYADFEGELEDTPGSCAQDTTMLSADRLAFTNEHPTKYGIIKPKGGYAVYQDAGRIYSHVLVDRIKRKEKFGGEVIDYEYDVVHYVADSGLVKRVVFATNDRTVFWEIPSRTLYEENEMQLKVLTAKISKGYAYFGTTASVIQLRIASCSLYSSCMKCSAANDPYCEWDALDNACKEIDFRLPVKRLYRNLNGTNCEPREIIVVNDDDLNENEVANLEERRQANEKLMEIVRKQNETIVNLRAKNDFLTAKLEESIDELSRLMTNYTQLSALLLQYDARRKMVIQLYRNTVFSLHACQHEGSQRITAERKGALGMNSTNVDCPTRKSGSKSCNCENEEETDPRLRGKAMARLKASFSRSLGSCQAEVSLLREELSLLEDAKKNQTKERDQLQKVISDMNMQNRRLKLAISRAGCAKWHLYAPSNKMFMVTRQMATFSEAQAVCAEHGGQIVEMKVNDEISFVHNLTQKIAPKKRYWMGLQKYQNGTLIWSDGTVFVRTATRVFSKSQNGRLRNREIYCIETTSREGLWQLLPCHKPRRVMCMKEFKGEIR